MLHVTGYGNKLRFFSAEKNVNLKMKVLIVLILYFAQ